LLLEDPGPSFHVSSPSPLIIKKFTINRKPPLVFCLSWGLAIFRLTERRTRNASRARGPVGHARAARGFGSRRSALFTFYNSGGLPLPFFRQDLAGLILLNDKGIAILDEPFEYLPFCMPTASAMGDGKLM
jgi:hypothetical protein